MTATLSYDPRPQVAEREGVWRVSSWRCVACGHALVVRRPRCPACRGALEPTDLGPGGTVWSSTVIRFRLPHREPPYVLAYVDLDGGGRVLAHVSAADAPVVVGTRVRVAGTTVEGDPMVEVES